MAYGTLCKHCGWEETDHDDASGFSDEEFETILPKRKASLQKCKGFVSEDPDSEARQYIDEISRWSKSRKFEWGVESRISAHAEKIGLKFPPSMERVSRRDDFELVLLLIGYRLK